jgi:hypothetical protein
MLAIERREFERQHFVEEFTSLVLRTENDSDRRVGLFLARQILDLLIPKSLESWSGLLEKSEHTEAVASRLFADLELALGSFQRTESERYAMLALIMRRLINAGLTAIHANLQYDELDPELIPKLLNAPRRDSEVDFPDK